MNKVKNTSKYIEENYFSDDNDDLNNEQNDSSDENQEDEFDDDNDDHNEHNEHDNNEHNEDNEHDDEYEEEVRKIVWEAVQKRSINYDLGNYTEDDNKNKTNKKDKTNKKQNNKNVNLSLGEFNKKLDEETKEKQPKKFISKRVEDKKKINCTNEEKVIRRSFNPRLPPYNWVHKSKETNVKIDLNNQNDFPSL